MKNTQSADTVPVHRHSPLVGVLEGASVLDLLCPKFTIESPDGILNPYSHKFSIGLKHHCRWLSSLQPGSVEPSYTRVPETILESSGPVLTSRKLPYLPPHKKSKLAWVETLRTIEDDKLGIIDLHPDIFATFPRIDVLWENIQWQQKYKFIDYRKVLNRAEMPGGGRKPWPQKGTGRARHGSIRSPLWFHGGAARGPRGPKSYFYMLPTNMRVLGLRNALTVKYAQDNLHIVDSLNLPTEDPSYLEEMVENRGWGLSVLFVDSEDEISHNFGAAVEAIKQYNVMPVYGLNVYSMLKHETLVLTLSALERIEERLLEHMHSGKKLDTKYFSSS